MLRQHTGQHLLCPACRYDVVQTLTDGIVVCPECGGAISEEACRVETQPLPHGIGNWFYNGLIFTFGLGTLLAVLLEFNVRLPSAIKEYMKLLPVASLTWCILASISVERWRAAVRESTSSAWPTAKGIGNGVLHWFGFTMLGALSGAVIGAIRSLFV